MKKQAENKKMTKEEKQLAEQKAYLMGLVPAEPLKKFTKKRAEKVAEIIASDRVINGAYSWTSTEVLFKSLIDQSKKGIERAERFIAIADFLATQGIKETKNLWGRSEYQADRNYLRLLRDLTDLSLNDWAKDGRVIIRNQRYDQVAKAYKYNRTAKELIVDFDQNGMIFKVTKDTSTIYPDKSCSDFEWVSISTANKERAIRLLLAGLAVELPIF